MAGRQDAGESSCKVFKCHSNMKVPNIVICLICESVFHERDFNKYLKGQYISEMFVICPIHHMDKLTSKSEYDLNTVDENARKIITQLKLLYKEELRNELCNNLSLNISKNNSDASEIQETDEINTLKMENELLKQLNTEL